MVMVVVVVVVVEGGGARGRVEDKNGWKMAARLCGGEAANSFYHIIIIAMLCAKSVAQCGCVEVCRAMLLAPRYVIV